jgi:tetratricopeptide (TPR) repeat protein
LSARSRRDQWAALYRESRQLAYTADWNGAFENATRALELIEALASADPADKGHRRWLALNYLSRGQALAKLNRSPEALEDFHKAIGISEELFRNDPDRVEVQRDLAKMHEATGLLFAEMEQTDGALENLKLANTLAESSAAHDPRNARIRNRLAEICQETGDLYWKLFNLPALRPGDRDAHLHAAHYSYQRSLELWTESKKEGMLNSIDAARFNELGRKIADCDAALKATP